MSHQLYRHFDKDGNLLYVGMSIGALSRLVQHKNSDWHSLITNVTIQHFTSKKDVMDAEREAIKSERPKHNIKHAYKPDPPAAPAVIRLPKKKTIVYDEVLQGRLMELRANHSNWSAVAVETGIPQSRLSGIVNGLIFPSKRELSRLGLEVSIEYREIA